MALTGRECLSRAYADTWEYFSPRKELVGSTAVFLVSGGVSLYRKGSAEMPDLVEATIAGTIGVFVVWGLFFVFNLLCAPYRIQRDRTDKAEKELAEQRMRASAADALHAATYPQSPEPISLLELAQVADRDFGWKLTSEHPSSGWEAWDLTNGLRHAANEGLLAFEGKDFGSDWAPSPNPFVRRDKLFTPIKREDWLAHALQIIVPIDGFRDAKDNFDSQIGGYQVGHRYFDVRVSDRTPALNWLKTKGPQWRGQSERLHVEEEAKRNARRALNPFAETEQGIDVANVERKIPQS